MNVPSRNNLFCWTNWYGRKSICFEKLLGTTGCAFVLFVTPQSTTFVLCKLTSFANLVTRNSHTYVVMNEFQIQLFRKTAVNVYISAEMQLSEANCFKTVLKGKYPINTSTCTTQITLSFQKRDENRRHNIFNWRSESVEWEWISRLNVNIVDLVLMTHHHRGQWNMESKDSCGGKFGR